MAKTIKEAIGESTVKYAKTKNAYIPQKLQELIDKDGPFLISEDIAPLCGYTAQTLRTIAKEDQEMFGKNERLPFTTICAGHTVKYPKADFIEWYMRQMFVTIERT